jgi:LysM repeat protein
VFDDPTPESTADVVRRVARRAAPVLAVVSLAIAAPLAATEITVQRGQTMGEIARDEHVTVARLAAFNGIANPNLIYEGQVLRIPPPEGGEFAHQIAPGETVGAIARRYGTTVEAIAKRNDLTNINRIVAGRSLVIPVPGAPSPTDVPTTTAAPAATAPPATTEAPTTTAAPATTVAPAEAPTTTAAPPPTTAAPATTATPPPATPGLVVSTIWVVQPGDTVASVAARFGLTPAKLAAANRIGADAVLTPGQYLFVPQR